MSTLLDLKNVEPGEEEQKLEHDFVEDPIDIAIPETISWETVRLVSAVVHRRRHMIIAVVAVLGAGIAIWQSSLLTFLAIILGLAAWEISDHFVHPVTASLDRHGLMLDGQHYAHTELASFDIHKMPDEAYELSVKTKHWHIPHLRIPLGEQDPREVYALLSQYVANERHAIPFMDYWLRK